MIEQHVATTRLTQRTAKSEERPPNVVMKPKETLPRNPYKKARINETPPHRIEVLFHIISNIFV